MNFSPVA